MFQSLSVNFVSVDSLEESLNYLQINLLKKFRYLMNYCMILIGTNNIISCSISDLPANWEANKERN